MRAKPKAKPVAKRGVRRAPDADTAEIYALVRSIPHGKVITYGEVAELVGRPSGHRFVAKAMRVCPESLPWQRVVGRHDARRSHISIHDPEHAALQRSLLEKEGVVFDAHGHIVMARSGWLPRDSGRKKRGDSSPSVE